MEAESSFLEAEKIVEELHELGGISQEEKTNAELQISTGLSRCVSKNVYFMNSSRYAVKIKLPVIAAPTLFF